jgi:hypothetical protein
MRRPAAVVVGVIAAAAVVAQTPAPPTAVPRLQSVFPLGAKAGTAVEVTAAGTDLDAPTGLLFSHPGIRGEVVAEPPKEKASPAKGKGPPPARSAFRVTVAADVPPGGYDVRVVSRLGVSNPRLFTVGDRPEVVEAEPNDDVDKAQRVALGTVVSGVIASPTDVDYYVFAGTAGQRVLVHCAAGSVDGKGRPWVEVYAGDGRTRLAENRNSADTDALADVTLPRDGDYYVRLTEFAHTAGGPDHFYRLTVGTGPWVDAVFPPAVEPGKPAAATVYGRNLPGGKPVPGMTVDGRPVESVAATVTPPAAADGCSFRGRLAPATGLLDLFEYRHPGAANAVPVFLTAGPVVVEKERGNDRPEGAEPIPVPCEVAGRTDRRGDPDWYSFPAKRGEPVMIELFADRLGTGQDLALVVRGTGPGPDIANDSTLDDDPDSLHPTLYFTRTGDPLAYRFVPPADGTYLVRVAPQASVDSGPRCGYRLRVGPPRPDFRAVAMPHTRDGPTGTAVHADGQAAISVYVRRADGFNGPLTATAEGLPAGVTATPAMIGPGQRWGTLVLTGAAGLTDAVADVTVKVTGTIDGRPVTHAARPASVTWAVPGQTTVPLVGRLDQSFPVAARADRAAFRLLLDPAPRTAKPGEKVTLPVRVEWQEKEPRAGPVHLSIEPTGPPNPPPAVTANSGQPLAIPKETGDLPVTLDVRANAAPGVYAVALRGETTVKVGKDGKDHTAEAFAPPVVLTVLPASLAKLTARPAGAVKPGGTAEVVVRVERQFDYAGPFRVTLDLPKASGLTAAEATVPAGANEVRVPVAAAKDAMPGPVPNVTVRAVGVYDGRHETPHETKVTLTVAK